MTFDSFGDGLPSIEAERLHGELATEYGRDDVFVTPAMSGEVVAIIGPDVGREVFERACETAVLVGVDTEERERLRNSHRDGNVFIRETQEDQTVVITGAGIARSLATAEQIKIVRPVKLHPVIGEDHVAIADDDGYEVVYWHRDEWIQNPDLCLTIATTVQRALTDPESVIKDVHGTEQWQARKNNRDEPAHAGRV